MEDVLTTQYLIVLIRKENGKRKFLVYYDKKTSFNLGLFLRNGCTVE